MALIPCPDCGRIMSDSAPSCIQCGRPSGAAAPAQAPPTPSQSADIPVPAAAPFARGAAGSNAPAAPQLEHHTLFPVATGKFVVMAICTFGFYELYWSYKNWQRIKERSGEDLSPFWRAVFSPLWGFSLFGRIREIAERRRVPVGWGAGVLGTIYLLLSMSSGLPDPWWLFSMLAFLPLMSVVGTIQAINATEQAAEGRNSAYSGANIATVIIGGLLMVLILAGTFLPDEGVA